MHTLTDGTTTIELSTGMLWRDEFSWVSQASRAQRAVDGTLLIEASAIATGRPVTLSGGQDYGWITRETLIAARAMLGQPGKVMTLTLDDTRVFQVVASPDEDPISAEMVMPHGRPAVDDYYFATVRLITV